MRFLVSFIMVLLGTLSLSADSSIILKVIPSVGNVPLTIRATLLVDKHIENREICFMWGKAGEGMGSQSCFTVEGDKHSRLQTYWRVLREPGEWFFQGAVRRNDEWIKSTPITVMVTGGFSE